MNQNLFSSVFKRPTIVLCLFLLSATAFGQDYGNDSEELRLCALMQNQNFSVDADAEEALKIILSTIGASKRFVLQPCDNINNALAISYKGIRYILYDREFMSSITDGNSWSNLFILAHEVGHHINGHTVDILLYTNEIIQPETLRQKRELELEADEFAGFILANVGGSISEINSLLRKVSSREDDTYSTHPSLEKRIQAVQRGYEKGRNGVTHDPTKEDLAIEFFYRGYSKQQSGRYQEAINDFTVSLSLNDRLEGSYQNRGMCYYSLGLDDEALKDFSLVNSLNGNGSSYYMAGVIKTSMANSIDDKYALESIQDLTTSISMAGDDIEHLASAIYSRGLAKFKFLGWESACSDFSTAKSLGWGSKFGYPIPEIILENLEHSKCES